MSYPSFTDENIQVKGDFFLLLVNYGFYKQCPETYINYQKDPQSMDKSLVTKMTKNMWTQLIRHIIHEIILSTTMPDRFQGWEESLITEMRHNVSIVVKFRWRRTMGRDKGVLTLLFWPLAPDEDSRSLPNPLACASP